MIYLFELIRVFSAIVLLSLPSACDNGVIWEDEQYSVEWLDSGENTAVYRKLSNGGAIRRVPPEVVAVASDSIYLTARVRSLGSDMFAYYYLEKKLDIDLLNGDEIAIGL